MFILTPTTLHTSHQLGQALEVLRSFESCTQIRNDSHQAKKLAALRVKPF